MTRLRGIYTKRYIFCFKRVVRNASGPQTLGKAACSPFISPIKPLVCAMILCNWMRVVGCKKHTYSWSYSMVSEADFPCSHRIYQKCYIFCFKKVAQMASAPNSSETHAECIRKPLGLQLAPNHTLQQFAVANHTFLLSHCHAPGMQHFSLGIWHGNLHFCWLCDVWQMVPRLETRRCQGSRGIMWFETIILFVILLFVQQIYQQM